MPSFTRKGFPAARDFSSLARRSASRMISADPFLRYVNCSSTEAKCNISYALWQIGHPLVEFSEQSWQIGPLWNLLTAKDRATLIKPCFEAISTFNL